MRHLTQSERFARDMWLGLYFQAIREAEHDYRTARELYQLGYYDEAKIWQRTAQQRFDTATRARQRWAALEYGAWR